MATILNPIKVNFQWSRPCENETIQKPNFKTFGIQIGSEFECSVLEPRLYLDPPLYHHKVKKKPFFCRGLTRSTMKLSSVTGMP